MQQTGGAVFISYAHEDIHRAAELAQLLSEAGVEVWWDGELQIGDVWRREIENRIAAAAKVIVLWSDHARNSDFVRDEASRAKDARKLLQLVLGTGGVPVGFGEIQHRRVADLKDVVPEILASLGRQAAPTSGFVSTAGTRISLTGLPTTSARLFGREIELNRLLDAWESGQKNVKTNVFSIIAIGGTGKTALLRGFLNALAAKGWAGASHVYAWSAYSQGSGENRNTSAAEFIDKALEWFGYAGPAIPSEHDRGVKLGEIVGAKRALLILDGIEPLQDLPIQDTAGVRGGRIRDHGLRGLIGQLADQNAGLCVITSRQEIVELGDRPQPMVRRTDLSDLSPLAGRQLLESLGVRGDPRLIAEAAGAAGGHALTLNLLGSYVAGVHGGVIDEARAAVDELMQHGTLSGHDRAARMMEGYVRRFEALADDTSAVGGGAPELALLHLVGLFDRPAEKDAIDVVKGAGLGPPLAALAGMTPQRWSTAVSRLRAQRLLLPRDPARPYDLDAHPLVRAHFGARLSRVAPDVFRVANLALYEHYKLLGLPDAFRTPEAYGLLADAAAFPDQAHAQPKLVEQILAGTYSAGFIPPGLVNPDPQRLQEAAKLIGTPAFDTVLAKFLPDDLAGMAPLFSAISHGAAAGEHRAAYEEVYFPRVSRGNEAFIVKKLGALGQDLAALAHFFAVPWSTPAPGLAERDQALMLSNAGFALRAQGRLRDAEEAYSGSAARYMSFNDAQAAAIDSANLSELRFTLGDISGAVAAAREAVDFAERAKDAFRRMAYRTTHANALHQAGDLDGVVALFAEAERLQAEHQPDLPRLYSVGGHRYCDLLLGMDRAAEVRERTEYAIELARANNWLLDIALDTLSLGRAAHALARASATAGVVPNLAEARRTLDAAVDGLRKAGTEDHLPLGLLARAACLRDMGEWSAAARDLKETREIAERGEMRLFLTDWHLESARLLLAQLGSAQMGSDPAPRRRPGLTPGAARKSIWQRIFGSGASAPPAQEGRREMGSDPQGLTPAKMRCQAEEHVQAAAKLIEATGYHRRDRELAELRTQLDAA